MTTHSVFAVGRPLLAKGAKGLAPGERIEARLRVAGTDDVFVSADTDQTAVALTEPEVRPRWKPMPQPECYCYGVAGQPIRRAYAAASGPKPWAGARAAQRLLIGSVVIADSGDLLDESKVLPSLRHGLNLRRHLCAPRRRRRQELTQVALRHRRLVELRGSSRISRVQRRHYLPVVAGGVDDPIHGICGRDTGSRGQRQCQTANRGSQSGQRQPHHVWIPSPTLAPPSRRRRQFLSGCRLRSRLPGSSNFLLPQGLSPHRLRT